MTSLTRVAAQRVATIATGRIPSDVGEKALLCLIDVLAAIDEGGRTELGPLMTKFQQSRSGLPEASVFRPTPRMVCAETAVFVNSTLAHSAIQDDMHLGACAHMGSMVVPTAIALAQRDDWSGEQLVRAIVAGYEMGALLGTALRRGGKVNPSFRASGMIGAFAAAAAAAAGNLADEMVTMHALGLAVNAASGINHWAWGGGSDLFIHMGTAARSGLTSWDLAHAGVRCSETVLEGRDGFFEAMGPGSDAVAAFVQWLDGSLGRGILDVRFKPVGSCNFTQTTTAIAVQLSSTQPIEVESIEAIAIRVPSAAKSYPGCDSIGPFESVVHAKMSIQFGVCAPLVHGGLVGDLYSKFGDPRIKALVSRCALSTSDEYDVEFLAGRQPAAIEIVRREGGRLYEEASDVPWLDAPDVVARFRKSWPKCRFSWRLGDVRSVKHIRDLFNGA